MEINFEEELLKSEDKYLRLYAEFENYKRRVQKEKEDIVKNTKIKTLESILDLDNDISIAINAVGEKEADGLKKILSKVNNFLKSEGIEEIQTTEYDSSLHDVIAIVESDKKGIVSVVSKGYTLNNVPFKYPKIILSKDV